MKRFLFLVVVPFLSLVNFTHGQQLNIYPTTLRYSLNSAGNSETQVINIKNNSDKSQAIELYLGDWDRNPNGSHTYFDAGTKSYSCADWVTLSTNFLNIGPNESAQVIVRMDAPDDKEELEKMKWAMLYVQGSEFREKIEESSQGVQTKINEIMRFGIHLYQTPAHLTTFSAKAESLSQQESNPELYDFEIINNGYTMVRVKSFLELTNVATGDEYSSKVEECPIFPSGKRIVSLALPKDLPKGQYSMLAILDYGDPNSLEAIEKIITIE